MFTIAKRGRRPGCPSVGDWIKRWYEYTKEYYSAVKKDEILPPAMTWMGLEDIAPSGPSQTDKDRCHMVSWDFT